MTNHEKIYDALKESIGEWEPKIDCAEIDSPPDAPWPWEEIDEWYFPAEPLMADHHHSPEESWTERIRGDHGIIERGLEEHGFEILAFYKSFSPHIS